MAKHLYFAGKNCLRGKITTRLLRKGFVFCRQNFCTRTILQAMKISGETFVFAGKKSTRKFLRDFRGICILQANFVRGNILTLDFRGKHLYFAGKIFSLQRF